MPAQMTTPRRAARLKPVLLAATLAVTGLCAVTDAFAADPTLAGAPRRGREAQSRSHHSGATSDNAGNPASQTIPANVETPITDQTVRVDIGGGVSRTLSLPRGKSAVIELPMDARDVVVSNPKVADVVLSTPRRIYVLGQTAGQTDAVFFDGSGRQMLRLDVRVDQDVSALAQTLNYILVGSQIRVEAVNDNIVLSGQVADAAAADKAVRVAQSFVTKPENVLNMLSVAGREQVMIRVRVVEVNRTVIKQLGFNLNELIGQTGKNQYMFGMSPTYGVNGSLLGGLTGGYKINTTIQPEVQVPCVGPGYSAGTMCPLIVHGTANGTNVATPANVVGSNGVNQASAMVQAFERAGLVRTLAEPNLTAISGESAKFLAGGEFPVPVGLDNTGRVSVEFKQYGVGLGFTPVVLSNGRISLKVSTEVSELSNTAGFTIGTGSSTTLVVPGLNVRRVETVVELPSGGATMIAGLIQNVTKQTLDTLPGLMELPVLGGLFRSRDFLNNQSELAVIITPYIVKPVSPDELATPADGLVIASDLETDLLGKLNKGMGKPAAAAGKTYQGPFGYVVE